MDRVYGHYRERLEEDAMHPQVGIPACLTA